MHAHITVSPSTLLKSSWSQTLDDDLGTLLLTIAYTQLQENKDVNVFHQCNKKIALFYCESILQKCFSTSTSGADGKIREDTVAV